MDLSNFPMHIIEQILSNFSYSFIAKIRETCKLFDDAGRRLLNNGFRRVKQEVVAYQADLRSHLPRRESERRIHPLNRHCETLSAVEARLTLLHISIMHYAQQGLCCFFPGRILDEVRTVCRTLRETDGASLCRPLEVLNELRDISSMAMEYFDEIILPKLPLVSTSSTSYLRQNMRPTASKEPMFTLLPRSVPLSELDAIESYRRRRHRKRLLDSDTALPTSVSSSRADSLPCRGPLSGLHSSSQNGRLIFNSQRFKQYRLDRMLSLVVKRQAALVRKNQDLCIRLAQQEKRISSLEQVLRGRLSDSNRSSQSPNVTTESLKRPNQFPSHDIPNKVVRSDSHTFGNDGYS